MCERSVLLGAGGEGDDDGVDAAGVVMVDWSVRRRDAKLLSSEVESPASVQKDM